MGARHIYYGGGSDGSPLITMIVILVSVGVLVAIIVPVALLVNNDSSPDIATNFYSLLAA